MDLWERRTLVDSLCVWQRAPMLSGYLKHKVKLRVCGVEGGSRGPSPVTQLSVYCEIPREESDAFPLVRNHDDNSDSSQHRGAIICCSNSRGV